MSTPDAVSDDKLASFLTRYESTANIAADNFGAMIASIGHIDAAFGQFFAWATSGKPASHGLIILGGLLLVIAVGVAAELAYRRIAHVSTYKTRAPSDGTLSGHLRAVLPIFALEVVGIAVFQGGCLVAFFLLHRGHLPTRHIVLAYLTALVVVRLLAATATMLFAPRMPAHRIVPLSTPAAHRVRAELVIAGAIAAFGFVTASLFRMAGLATPIVSLLLFVPYVLFFVAILAMIFTLRADLRHGPGPGAGERWPIIAIIYVTLIFLAGQVAAHLGQTGVIFAVIGSLVLGGVVPLVDALLRGSLTGQGRPDSTPDAAASAEGRMTVAAGAKATARALLYLAAAVLLLRIWGIDLLRVAADGFGGIAAQVLTKLVLTIVLALVAWELVKAAIDRKIAGDAPARSSSHGDGDGGGVGSSRLATLLPLFRKFLLATILVMASMTALSSIGIDIGPLLAGAGVVGLAIGFGAQALVRDIVSGVFFLLDDAFRVGEYIEIGSNRGRVERISIRSLRLRHHRGALLTVPFGEIKTLTNHSRDWAIVKLSFRLSFGTDPAKVKKIVKRISAELLEHPEYGAKFVEPLKSQGVRGMDETGITFGVKFMAKPGEQFQLRRESYQRLLAAFEAAGISLARPQVIVQMPQDTRLDDAQRAALQAGAAAQKVQLDQGARAAQ